ncbi:hypothetical protein TURU_144680 [Turdus rufiventris]|nr:hypothetical protein TURU_144680 [Turdus rufiventris]
MLTSLAAWATHQPGPHPSESEQGAVWRQEQGSEKNGIHSRFSEEVRQVPGDEAGLRLAPQAKHCSIKFCGAAKPSGSVFQRMSHGYLEQEEKAIRQKLCGSWIENHSSDQNLTEVILLVEDMGGCDRISSELTNYPLKTEWNSEDCTEVIAVFDNRELGNLFQNIEKLTLNVLMIIESIAFK